MSSYIFNFKKFIFSFFITLLILLFSAQYIVNFYLDIKTNHNKNQFIEYMKDSKSRHMLNKYNFKNYDKIFIGSSKTQYHISKNLFADKNINIYNYGVSAQYLYNYPYMVNKSILLEPQEIVISLTVNSLYEKHLNKKQFKGIVLKDFVYIIKTHSLKEIKLAFMEVIKNLYLPFMYAQNINSKTIQLFNKLDFKLNKEKVFEKKIEINKKKLEQAQYTNPYIDCTPFKEGLVINCTNGDGILLSNSNNLENNKNISFLDNKKLNINKINFLNIIYSEIKKKNINFTLILEPMRDEKVNFDILFLKSKLNFNIIDATNVKIKNEYWSDNSHLNSKGRIFYTNFLITQFN